MTQQPRKTAKKAPTKKPAGTRKPVSPPGAAETEEAAPDPVATEPDQMAASSSVKGEVVDSGSSTRTDRSDNVQDDVRHITTNTVESRHTTREYEHGRRVTETVTVTTNRHERIPLPYAGPVSSHPAPVG